MYLWTFFSMMAVLEICAVGFIFICVGFLMLKIFVFSGFLSNSFVDQFDVSLTRCLKIIICTHFVNQPYV
jgi:hypothetical protein